MRRDYVDRTTGGLHVRGSRSVASQDAHRVKDAAARAARRSDTYALERSECSWLIPHEGDIDRWRWLPERSFAFPTVGRRDFAKLERTWRLMHTDLRIGPLGGFGAAAMHPSEAIARCPSCCAPHFLSEARTKCCLFQ